MILALRHTFIARGGAGRKRCSAGLLLFIPALIAFIAMRAAVPAGYMPSDGADGTHGAWYMLCHGDRLSKQLITNHHNHHAHHTIHSAASSDTAVGAGHEGHHNHAPHTLGKHHAKQGVCAYAAQILVFTLLVFGLLYTALALTESLYFLYGVYRFTSPRFTLATPRAPPCHFIA
ncbi:hypothetical protein [Saccharophagus degradans]|uniref:Uncharacterized protein n=1 Tax=Saccharophagus degradans (strain 2-40 / ATCC 43961 / DSM 17024) TaxID=203122 RepID=Q21NC6_SACD2|nr:hypothetical protein [Saccharophagus degradans]ABD79803.1 hypothetical protein Sde_0539 [Saccharophagus degradans 2-40]